jgi:lipid A oxidase
MPMRATWLRLVLIFGALAVIEPAAAEWQIGAYGGVTFTHDSDVRTTGPATGGRTFSDVGWEGQAFEGSPYYGVRATGWFGQGPGWGVQLDFSHTKAAAKLDGRLRPDFSRLEFTDGLNIATLNGVYRWAAIGRIVPYVGAGVGANIPHVEVTNPGFARTFEYQVGGVSAVGFAGFDFALTDSFSVFTEYKLSYSRVDADLESGGRLSTDLVTHHLNLGLQYRFSLF